MTPTCIIGLNKIIQDPGLQVLQERQRSRSEPRPEEANFSKLHAY